MTDDNQHAQNDDDVTVIKNTCTVIHESYNMIMMIEVEHIERLHVTYMCNTLKRINDHDDYIMILTIVQPDIYD